MSKSLINAAELLRRQTLIGKALVLPVNFLSFYQSTAFSSRAMDGHQMYSRGSVIGKASTIGIEISPTHSPYFYRGGG